MPAKITDAVPTGTGAIAAGTKICLGIRETVNVNIGNGVVTALSDYNMVANGNYNYDLPGYQGKGQWSISMDSSDSGNTYKVQIAFNGTLNMNETFTATANESDGKIVYQGTDHTLTQSDQNDTIFQKAKVWLETNIDNQDIKLYVYSSDQYGSG